MKPKITLTIAGSDSGGGAGVQADLKTFSALEVHGTSVITSLTAQNTLGVDGILDTPEDFVKKQIDSVAQDFEVEWAKTGMVSNSKIIEAILEKAKEYKINLVVDPIMIAATGSSLIRKGAIKKLKELIGEATLVTPNIPEAEKLSDTRIDNIETMKTAAEKISEIGVDGALIKGGHLSTEKIVNLLHYKNSFKQFERPRIDAPEIHGTGCTFSAAITAELTKGNSIPHSIEKASDFMVDAVRGRLKIGKGVETINPMARMWKVTGNGEEIQEVQKAAKKLERSPEFARLIPEVGSNIAMAKKDARTPKEVVGLTGRIVKVRGTPHMTGVPDFGGSEHVTNIVLTVMGKNPEIRSAMNIKFSEKILEICKNLEYELSSFDRENEPENVKTMSWGTERAIEKLGKVPNIIYDRGSIGKEAMIRILGKKATEVSEIALKIGKKLD